MKLNLKRVLPLISLLSICGNSNAQTLPEYLPKRDYVLSQSLYVQNNPRKRNYSFLDEETGEKNCVFIANSSRIEEAYVFLPNRDLWVEIGIFGQRIMTQDKNAVKDELAIDKKLLESILLNEGEVIVYHTHPVNKKEIKSILERLYSPTELSTGIKLWYDRDAIPSELDINHLINNSLRYTKVNYAEKICSKLGVTEYKITEKGMNVFKENPNIINDTIKKISKWTQNWNIPLLAELQGGDIGRYVNSSTPLISINIKKLEKDIK